MDTALVTLHPGRLPGRVSLGGALPVRSRSSRTPGRGIRLLEGRVVVVAARVTVVKGRTEAMVLSETKQGMKRGAAALWLSTLACTPASPPHAPGTGEFSILNPAGVPDAAEAGAQPGAAALEIVPGRVRSNYISKSEGAAATVERNAAGWHLTFSAPAAKAGEKAEFAGYCWEITELNATRFNTLALDLSLVSQPAEIQIRLEQKDASIHEGKLEYLTQGTLVVDLANYPLVRPAVNRLCLIASGSSDTPAATSADFVVRRVILQ